MTEVDSVSEADEEIAGAIVARATDPANPAADLGTTRCKPVTLTAVVDPNVAASGHYTLTIGAGIALFDGTTQILPDPGTGSLTRTYAGTATLPTTLKAIGTAVTEESAFIQLDFIQDGQPLYTDRTVVNVMHTTPQFLAVIAHGSQLRTLPHHVEGKNIYVSLPSNYPSTGGAACYLLVPIDTQRNGTSIPKPSISAGGVLSPAKFADLSQIDRQQTFGIAPAEAALEAWGTANGFLAVKFNQPCSASFTVNGN